MEWARRTREAYLAIGRDYEATRTRPLPVADFGRLGEKALDVGAGRGTQPLYLETEHKWVVHCDLDKRLLPSGDVLECEASMLPFRDGAFDVAYLVAVVHHMPRDAAARALAEAGRVARRVVATSWLPDRGREVRPSVWEVPWGHKAVRTYYLYVVEDLAALVPRRPLSLGVLKRGRQLNYYVVY
ncbi:MAG: methyltransferase domain-containing protein [Pyrobaculum sp.]